MHFFSQMISVLLLLKDVHTYKYRIYVVSVKEKVRAQKKHNVIPYRNE